MKNKVAYFRKIKGWSQEKLSKEAQISRPYLSEIETGTQKVVTNIVMIKIAKALEKSVEEVFFTPDVV